MKRFGGHCHCGNLSFLFEASAALEELGLRACQCSFCRGHNARAISDPRGQIHFRVHEPKLLSRYRMGHGITDFLICARCGVFARAVMDDNGKQLMTLNANSLVPCPPLPAEPIDYGGESTEQRIARRRRRWTPVNLEIG